MDGIYLCVFVFLFLGILGAANLVLSVGELFYAGNCQPTYIKHATPDDIECRVRDALKSTRGDVIIILTDTQRSQKELADICARLCTDNPRVRTASAKHRRAKRPHPTT